MWRSLVILSLLTLLAYGGVRFMYGRLEGRLQSEMAGTANKAVPVAGGGPKQVRRPGKRPDYQVIVRRNIFQARLDLKKKETAEGQKPEDLAETSLKLALVGTVTGSDRDARAIIVDEKKKRQDIYQIGDVVQGALIKKVERGRVILEVNGRDEVLLLKERKGGTGRESGLPSFVPPVYRPPVQQRDPSTSRERKDIPVVRPHRRITFRKDRAREIREPVEPLPAEILPSVDDVTAGAAGAGQAGAGGEQGTGEDEAAQYQRP